jgi:hypothetical protein
MNDYRRACTPAEMARMYSESRLVFNCSLRGEVNMRVFEGPATGTLLLTDRISNGLSDLVRDREHVVLYDDEQLLNLVDEYLRDSAARELIASQGYEHVRAYHTYDQRVENILETVLGSGARSHLRAPLRCRSDADVHLAYAELFSLVRRVDDTIEEVRRLPSHPCYRIAAAKSLVWCLARRLKQG